MGNSLRNGGNTNNKKKDKRKKMEKKLVCSINENIYSIITNSPTFYQKQI